MESNGTRTWNTLDVIFSLVAVLGGVFLLQSLHPGAASGLGNALYLGVSYLFILVVVFIFTVVKYGSRLSDLGLKSFKPVRAVMLGISWWLAVYVAIQVYSVAVTTIASRYGVRPPVNLSTRVPDLFGAGAFGFILALLIAVIVGPFVEEVFFRGFVYTAFKRRLGPWPAMFVSSLIFGVFHVNGWLIVPTGLMGFVMAYLYEKEGSLAAPLILHSLNNLVSVVIVYTLYVK